MTGCFSVPCTVAVLGIDLLVTVLTELLQICTDWYNIGLSLGMKVGTLDRMKAGTYRDPQDCLRDMLKEWLTTSPEPSWEGLIKALRHPILQKNTLANQLERKYCAPG